MAQYLFPPAAPAVLRVVGETALFPVWRVYCVGRNYRAHSQEMIKRLAEQLNIKDDKLDAPPFFSQKPAYGAVTDSRTIPYPPKTQRLEHELELVVALGDDAAVYGCALGVDLTRRDLQDQAKAQRRSRGACRRRRRASNCASTACCARASYWRTWSTACPRSWTTWRASSTSAAATSSSRARRRAWGCWRPATRSSRAFAADGAEALPACEFVVGEARL